ncbi:MAG: thioredoxin [Candidatus Omnitrophota bacterium]|nr:MAG: thioredoxin [Candidatus Omnitrophota bacterium]HDN85824.1 thioredoxin [Candidatus Omnitrophota bacterium]
MAVELTEANFQKEVLETDMPVLVDFWAPWCMPCLITAPVIEKIAEEYKGRIKVCKLNVEEASSVASNYGVMSIPTIMVFKNGEIVNKTVGALSKEDLEEFIKPYI